MAPAVLHLTFAGWTWLLPALGVLAVTALLVFWGGRRIPWPGLRLLCAALKLVAVALLAACLLEPLWSRQRARPGANLFALVADDSQSHQVRDAGSRQTRGEVLRDLLDVSRPGWQSKLSEDFEVRRYTFASRLQNVPDFQALAFDGPVSGLATALRTLGERFRGRPLAGVLLFSDGNATDVRGELPDLKGLPPVYPVVVGDRTDTRDLAIAQVGVTQSAFEDAPVTIQADLGAVGLRGERVVAQLVDTSGRVLQEEARAVRKDPDDLAVRFQFKPTEPGLSFYRFQATRKEATPAPGATDTNRTDAAEATLTNNRRVVAVDRGRGPYRVLYVSGRPNWEFKFLNRAVSEDKEIELVALIRVARREPRFEFRGRAGETSNPLFRGFGNQSTDEIERYDQPVLARLNTRDEMELRAGFPRTAEELYGYHAVILDDLEAAFFSPDQAALLQHFVSERGGGFLMLGGTESFREGEYHRTPIGDLLPVYLDRPPDPLPDGPVRFELSREGWLEPWARVRDQETAERERLDAMPLFQVANRVRGTKPGASVIATAKDAQGRELPAVAIQRFGRGRSGAVLVGDLWRWGLRDPIAHADLDKSWRQLVRWLVADVPQRVELAVEPVSADPNGAVRLEARVRDPKFQPMDDASVTIEVSPVTFADGPGPSPAATNAPPAGATGTGTLRLRAEAAGSEPGLFVATYLPRVSGGFRATALVTNAAGLEHGRAEAGWSSDPAAEEFRSLVPNVALLENIARATGGQVLRPADLEAFVRRLPTLRAPVMEAFTEPAWHTPWLLALALACLAGEWGLRRWRGLP